MPQKTKKIPMRMCVSCREMKPKKELTRIVCPETADGESSFRQAIIDPRGKLSGRGAYLCHDMECLKKAKKSRAVERALECVLSPQIWDALEKEATSPHE